MPRRKQKELVRGQATHRRTEGDYMSTLLETVTLDDWRAVVNRATAAAKAGDGQARAWLGQYLMGKPDAKAPTPLTVVVQQLNGSDPVVNRLAKPEIERQKYPNMHVNDGWEDQIRTLVAAELANKVKTPETIESPALARLCGPSGTQFPTDDS